MMLRQEFPRQIKGPSVLGFLAASFSTAASGKVTPLRRGGKFHIIIHNK